VGVLNAATAFAQEPPVQEVTTQAAPSIEKTSTLDFIAAPFPVVNPTIGNGGAGVAALIYKIDADSPPSSTGVGGFYSDTKSWAAGVAQTTYLSNDLIHANGSLFYYDLHYKFFGIGAAAGSRGRSVSIEQSGVGIIPELLVRVWPHTYLGLGYRYLTAKTGIDAQAESSIVGTTIPGSQLDLTTSSLGPVVEYDSRDDRFWPTTGTFARVIAAFSNRAVLGSGSNYRTFTAAYNGYVPIGEKQVLAYRASVCGASNGTPFFDLCSYGSNSDLRGYVSGQYIDKRMFSAQLEYRWRFYWRFGLTAFAGVGGVAPAFNQFEFDKLLPAAGLGIRFLASEENHVNIGLDFAVGKRSSALYFRIGEAF